VYALHGGVSDLGRLGELGDARVVELRHVDPELAEELVPDAIGFHRRDRAAISFCQHFRASTKYYLHETARFGRTTQNLSDNKKWSF
jgi:hypothetical protein